jgi:molecular chaperone DnaK
MEIAQAKAGAQEGAPESDGAAPADDDVVDAEFEEVKEDK